MSEQILKIPAISEMTGVPVDTLRWYRHRQTAGYADGPRMFKLGRNVVAKESDVLAWVAKQYGDEAAPESGPSSSARVASCPHCGGGIALRPEPEYEAWGSGKVRPVAREH